MTRPLSSYLLFFALAYVGMLILFTIISMFISSAGGSASIIAPFIAAMLIGELFIKRENRAPNDTERGALTLGSFIIFVTINLAIVALMFLSGGLGDAFADGGGTGVLAIVIGLVFLVIFLIVFFMIRWAYGGLTRKRAEKLLGHQSDTFD